MLVETDFDGLQIIKKYSIESSAQPCEGTNVMPF